MTGVQTCALPIYDVVPTIYRTDAAFSKASTAQPRNIVVSYRHGYETPPADIKQAALVLARARLVANVQGTGVPAHASSWSDSSGTYTSFAASSKTNRWYGMPVVDGALTRHNMTVGL